MKANLISLLGVCLMAVLVFTGCNKDDETPENQVKITVSGSSFTFDENYKVDIPFLVSPVDYDASTVTLLYSDFHFTSEKESLDTSSSLSMPSVATSVVKDTSTAGKWIMSCKLKDGKTGKDFTPGDFKFSYSVTVSLQSNGTSSGSFGMSASN